MTEQLEMVFEQSDDFHRYKAEYDQAMQEEKLIKSLLNKFSLMINSEIREKQARMQATCSHPQKYTEHGFDVHKREDEYTEYCEVCGKMLRHW